MPLMEMHLQNLITGTPVRTNHLLSNAQSNDLKKSGKVTEEHVKARSANTLGLLGEEISGVRGIAFFVVHLDEFGKETGIVAPYFACELFRPF